MSSNDPQTGRDATPATIGTDCVRCNNRRDAEYYPDPTATTHIPGEICGTPARVLGLVKLLLKGDLPPRTAIHDERPCVVMEPTPATASYKPGSTVQPQLTRSTICLMTSFHKTTYAELRALPQIIQRLCITVFPHPSDEHVHTDPEWCGDCQDCQWLFAYRFQYEIHTHWQNRCSTTPNTSSFRLDEVELAKLVSICERKKAEWDAFVQEPENVPNLDELMQEYKNIIKKMRMKDKRRAKLASRASAGVRPSTPYMENSMTNVGQRRKNSAPQLSAISSTIEIVTESPGANSSVPDDVARIETPVDLVETSCGPAGVPRQIAVATLDAGVVSGMAVW
ncbi:hypothetical protein BD413DRAFT_307544 [Trametes elegans]|nr:hypothetical protein BD413DRAFT_307544 [Trametes elegans]